MSIGRSGHRAIEPLAIDDRAICDRAIYRAIDRAIGDGSIDRAIDRAIADRWISDRT